MTVLLCSHCFVDEGLRISAYKLGDESPESCPQCGGTDGKKLTKEKVHELAFRFFVSGTTRRLTYGGAPGIQFNDHHYGKSTIAPSEWLKKDIQLLEEAGKIGFFHYGPRLWMVGEVEPLKALQAPETRPAIIERILKEYPVRLLSQETSFYRLRRNPNNPSSADQYDAPPVGIPGDGRLDFEGVPVMYGSQDIDICVHECRVTVEDELYVATLKTNRELRLLDLTEIVEDGTTEFESIDIAVHMLFLAGKHSYPIARDIAAAAHKAGFDGVIYPSFFSLMRTGGRPFETVYGISVRRIPQMAARSKSQMIENFALFGRPVEAGKVRVDCMNRLVLTQIGYQAHFGPVTY